MARIRFNVIFPLFICDHKDAAIRVLASLVKPSQATVLAVAAGLIIASPLTTLPATGDLDGRFNPEVDGGVSSMALQTNGRIVIAGDFLTVGGMPRYYFARLDPDGTLDPDFNAILGDVFTLAIMPDGRILVGAGGLARLNADSTPDQSFAPNVNGTVTRISIQADGKIVIGGLFTMVGGSARFPIARLNANGSLDSGFDPKVNQNVLSMAAQPDGKLIIGGPFTSVNDVPRNRLARINSNGTLDLNFDSNVNGAVWSIALQGDGKIIIGGDFSGVSVTPRNRLARLNVDGTLDVDFDPNINGTVYTSVVQADGKIVIGGDFTSVGGTTRNYFARLNPNGTLDSGFNPHTDFFVRGATVQTDGKIVIGGDFNTVGGVTRNYIARLLNDRATQNVTAPSAHEVQWLRGGASPETHDVTFELSTDGGLSWSMLGTGTRIAGGWKLTGLNLPPRGLVRARARVIGGRFNGSSSLVETIVEFPSVGLTGPTQLANGTFRFGFTNWVGSSFTALATTNLSFPLTNWSVLGPVSEITPGKYQFTDPNAVNLPQRFYQIRSP